MKTLQDHGIRLHGVEVISATELRAHLGECLTQVAMGKSFCVKRKGTTVAYLTLDHEVVEVARGMAACGCTEVPAREVTAADCGDSP